MRAFILGLTVSFALAALPARAQADSPTPAPIVDAAAETWQINGEPMLFEGNVYVASGPTRFFDSNLMVRVGVYLGIPVYQDKTLEPWSVVYVPVALKQMRPYDRKKTTELAPVGSQTSSILADVAVSPFSWERMLVSRGQMPLVDLVPTSAVPTPAPATRRMSATAGSNGIYIEFNDAKWYGSGRPVSYSSLFVVAGEYNGGVVYRLRTDHKNRIWVPVVPGGPLAPYSKR